MRGSVQAFGVRLKAPAPRVVGLTRNPYCAAVFEVLVQVPLADWKKPTDAAYAFRLRPRSAFMPRFHAVSDIRDVVREALADGEAERFERRIRRWDGPEDEVAGERPYGAPQLVFAERNGADRLGMADVERVLRGTVLVLKTAENQVDYVVRDHHMLDVVLFHWRNTGELPTALFHADRHSDWCADSYLNARVPEQAATWWKLVEGLKREDGTPVLREEDVVFTTAKAASKDGMVGRDVGASERVPWFVERADLPWDKAISRAEVARCDWVSLDLDDFQPSAQLALTKGLLRDARFRGMVRRAKVRVFCLSPQFTNGGEKIASWTVQGRLWSTLRVLNWIRAAG